MPDSPLYFNTSSRHQHCFVVIHSLAYFQLHVGTSEKMNRIEIFFFQYSIGEILLFMGGWGVGNVPSKGIVKLVLLSVFIMLSMVTYHFSLPK